MARVAMFNRAMLYFAASGAFRPDECAASKDPIPFISEKWSPEKAGIKERYPATKEQVTMFRNTTDKWNSGGNSGGRFIAPLGPFYQATGHHGFSIWERNSNCLNEFKNVSWGCTGYDLRGPCYDHGKGLSLPTVLLLKQDPNPLNP